MGEGTQLNQLYVTDYLLSTKQISILGHFFYRTFLPHKNKRHGSDWALFPGLTDHTDTSLKLILKSSFMNSQIVLIKIMCLLIL